MAIILFTADDEGEVRGEGFTTDVSEYGARVQTNVPLQIGQTVDVSPSHTPEYMARGRVVWLGEPQSDQRGEAGLAFMAPLSSTS